LQRLQEMHQNLSAWGIPQIFRKLSRHFNGIHQKQVKMKKQSNQRAGISIGIFILFILLILSAITIEILEELPYSTTLHAVHHVCTAIHVISGFLFAVFGIFHIVYNWRTLKHYLKGK
jgi:hypothetical protein